MDGISTKKARNPGNQCRSLLQKRLEYAQRLKRQLKRLIKTKKISIYTVVGFSVFDPGAAFLLFPLAVVLIPAVFLRHRMASKLYQEGLAVEFYRNAIARMEDRWVGRGDAGVRYLTSDPLFADDLDLFGRGSLFQLLCAARTSIGKDTLASWLLRSGTVAEIRERQEAVRELSQRLDIRESLAVLEFDREKFRLDVLAEWGNAADPSRESTARFFGVSVVVSAVVLWSFVGFGFWFIVGVLLMEFGLRTLLRDRLQANAVPAAEMLQARAALAIIRNAVWPVSFHSRLLTQIRTTICSREDGSTLVHAFYGFVVRSPFLLLMVRQFTSGVDRWRRDVAAQSQERLLAWGQLEALASLAQYRFEQPDTSFPEVVSASPCFEATQIGHPLIPASRRVTNDVTLNDSLRLLMVSGSNMSGKSTMLRTVGINAVLALAGGPVCGERLRLTPFAIGTAMRFHDSLEQQTSHFYAVLTRLRRIMQLPTDGQPLLFLIDEILQGTNSRDRVTGAEALAKALLKRNSVGFITTHDLELTRIVDSLGEHAANVNFVDQLVDDELHFDYIMRPGVVQSGNALVLMRKMGLDV